MKIAFIGGGNMARSLIGGLVAKGQSTRTTFGWQIPQPQQLAQLQQAFGVNTCTENRDALTEAEALVLAVKPQVMGQVCQSLREYMVNLPLTISIAAGISAQSLAHWLGTDVPIVRAMPNTPALVEAGATGLYANQICTREQKAMATSIASAVGIATWLDDEALIDAVTAVSGSGPAYYFLMMEAMIEAAQELGLSKSAARQLTLQTALGAAQMAIASDKSPDALRTQVTSKGGTTEQAIASFEQDGFRDMVAQAMRACANRAHQMSLEFSN